MTQAKTEPPPNVYQRLNRARMQFHSVKLKKSGRFPKGRGDYFELADFIVPALKAFDDHGLTGAVSFADGAARLDVFNAAAPDEVIRFESPMGSANLQGCHEVQNIGAVQTYQRRYLWMLALEIVEHDAIDSRLGEPPAAIEPIPDEVRTAGKEYPFPDGPATGITQLKAMARALWREVEGCGDESELLPLIEAAENKAIIDQLERLQDPEHRKIWEGDGQDNPGLAGHIQRKRAIFMAEYARA
jgi:hypothetical protein